jgi:hypothetical protein
MPIMQSPPSTIRERWEAEGYFTVRGALPLAQIAALRAIIEDVLSNYFTRDPDTGQPGDPDANSVRHLHRPEYFAESRERFATLMEIITDPAVLRPVKEAFGADPVFRDTSLWFNPFFTHRDGHWHRDVQYVVSGDEEERARLSDPSFRACAMQVQVPLVFSDELEYVPGSHLRWDTPEEYAIRKADGCRNRCSNAMPGALRIAGGPSDIHAINPAGIHRGRYHADKIRRTLQITFTTGAHAGDYSSEQAWFFEPAYLAPLSGRAYEFFASSRDVLLSHRRREGGADRYWHR